MSTWIPISKKTGVEQPAISQAEKEWYESENSPVKGKFKFREIKEKAPPAPPPVEAKVVPKKEEI